MDTVYNDENGIRTKRLSVVRTGLIFLMTRTRLYMELKPNNPRGIRDGIRQLQRYNEALGGGYTLFLELY